MDPFNRFTNGSFTGYFFDPFNTECSKIWNTPVSSSGIVLNVIAKVLFSSSRFNHAILVLVYSYTNSTNSPSQSLIGVVRVTRNPGMFHFVIFISSYSFQVTGSVRYDETIAVPSSKKKTAFSLSVSLLYLSAKSGYFSSMAFNGSILWSYFSIPVN